ncbi:hypothetical protein HNQ95_006032 [Aminobacter ciceronei]|uniref:Uncharacterized protein n=3 Tax=Aminobacter TaxID=31988 RepID=A0AAC8YJ93_AMIAI|nr:hypothetical protein AA2016_0401 [Aminobacter aminovorans]MBA8910219.1 hypothetical protein [Aminobacter ciceronei]MBA9023957.1 hypothetical protein [Aminobacter ciceronei]MBB3709952.1 hypothetical protein [Aminobacter aminovorans]MBB6470409.1 hypothetical protein [Aminobacter lissarensis]
MPIKAEDGETREFLVIPPAGVWFDTRRREIATELERRFPNMKFTVTMVSGEQDDRSFKVVPILGTADGKQPMLKWPSMDVIEEVLDCLAGFIVQSETKPILH